MRARLFEKEEQQLSGLNYAPFAIQLRAREDPAADLGGARAGPAAPPRGRRGRRAGAGGNRGGGRRALLGRPAPADVPEAR